MWFFSETTQPIFMKYRRCAGTGGSYTIPNFYNCMTLCTHATAMFLKTAPYVYSKIEISVVLFSETFQLICMKFGGLVGTGGHYTMTGF